MPLWFSVACGGDGGTSDDDIDASIGIDAARTDASDEALVLTSTAFTEGGLIPSAHTSLAEGVEKVAEPFVPAGSKQVRGYGTNFGYDGPCPPNRSSRS